MRRGLRCCRNRRSRGAEAADCASGGADRNAEVRGDAFRQFAGHVPFGGRRHVRTSSTTIRSAATARPPQGSSVASVAGKKRAPTKQWANASVQGSAANSSASAKAREHRNSRHGGSPLASRKRCGRRGSGRWASRCRWRRSRTMIFGLEAADENDVLRQRDRLACRAAHERFSPAVPGTAAISIRRRCSNYRCNAWCWCRRAGASSPATSVWQMMPFGAAAASAAALAAPKLAIRLASAIA